MAGKSILIVEDHTMIAEYVASVLRDAGYQAIQAGSLAEARRALADRRFDLLLSDRWLPDGEGHELLTGPGDGRVHPAPPAVLMSAELDRDEREKLLAHGFADALAKPCPPQVLLDRIAQVLGGNTPHATAQAARSQVSPAPVLDDEAALAVCAGNAATLASMRKLFATELPAVRERIAACAARGDTMQLAQELHRLCASAAWVGAAEVRQCCDAARTDPGQGPEGLDAALARVQQALSG
ncbi:response regulator [Pseudofulvimonas gallinarii]|jgi:DNA-binding response OmpR family regulator|uniref:Response regulator receiver domain-containing protein n=1 Tax=Pseudofulvimonas gallinarii TaxID=634155 RepID=A0A4S3L077_9GAMM|nr:response regulator [Pseudofulvimonas gallinarii]TCT01352.1 response regulator receiver domain-containing protein [Pseudofulvimonas gallinarii]THD15105.1 hypothetical protein B1808_01580 [Pseudofulvimonas gallinarii]